MDDLNEYKESIQVSLGAGNKIQFSMDNEPAEADCVFILQLDPQLPAIQEEYANIMQQLDPVHCHEIAKMMVEYAETVWLMSEILSGSMIQTK